MYRIWQVEPRTLGPGSYLFLPFLDSTSLVYLPVSLQTWCPSALGVCVCLLLKNHAPLIATDTEFRLARVAKEYSDELSGRRPLSLLSVAYDVRHCAWCFKPFDAWLG